MSKDGTIIIGEKKITLTVNIEKVIDYFHTKIILVEPKNEYQGKNIVAFNLNGTFKWIVESIVVKDNKSSIWTNGDSFYNIWINAGLNGVTASGFSCVISIETGNIISKIFTK